MKYKINLQVYHLPSKNIFRSKFDEYDNEEDYNKGLNEFNELAESASSGNVSSLFFISEDGRSKTYIPDTVLAQSTIQVIFVKVED